jgi:DNA-binding LacI/PurR family transcriptional regulator
MGEAAVAQLLDRIAAPQEPARTLMFSPTLVHRGSTAPTSGRRRAVALTPQGSAP